MEFTAEAIANYLEGTVEGDPSIAVTQIAPIEKGNPNSLSFLANPKYNEYLYTTESSVVLINEDFKLEKEVSTTLIRVKDAYSCYAKLLELHHSAKYDIEGIAKHVDISEDASLGETLYIGNFVTICDGVKIGNNVKIFPNCYIGENVKIGDNSILFPNVSVHADTQIGKNCMIHSGAVLGDDGFGFAPEADGTFRKIAQLGNVVLEDNVEIGSNTCVDRAALGTTLIQKGTKIDNLVQVAHNVKIGTNTGIAGQAGIAGSSTVGNNCLIAGQVGISGHINVPDKTILLAQAGVAGPIKKAGQILQGTPCIDNREFKKSFVVQKQLPELRQKIFELEKRLKELEE